MLGNFACARYRFVLEASTPLRLNAFAGSTLRGGFGHVFKRTVCIWPPGDCPRCLLKNTCSYPYIFETAPPPGSAKLRSLDQIPRPFVIDPPQTDPARPYQPGETFDFRLVLIGRAIDYLPYFVFTFCELGRAGLGPGRGQFRLIEVHAEGLNATQRIYTADEGVLENAGERITANDLAARSSLLTECLVVHFLTPTRIRNDGAIRAELSFQDLVRALLRRLSSLCYFHCGCELKVDFKCLIEQAALVRTLDSNLHWHDQDRFSGRQHRRIDMGGVLGTATFAAPAQEVLAPYLPLLAAGELVHVGKGCVMGLGKYEIAARP